MDYKFTQFMVDGGKWYFFDRDPQVRWEGCDLLVHDLKCGSR